VTVIVHTQDDIGAMIISIMHGGPKPIA